MARIAGVSIPDKKRIEFSLPYIYGVGRALAEKILVEAGVEKGRLTQELSPEELNRIKDVLENSFEVEGNLRRRVSGNIKRLKEVKTYRGTRHIRGLPVRGQRTKTNSRTRRGNVRRTTISGKRKVEKK